MKTLKTIVLAIALISIGSCKAETKKDVALIEPTEVKKSVNEHYIRVALLLDTS